MRAACRVTLISALVIQGGCPGQDPLAPQASPDGRFTLTASFHDRTLIRLTVQERTTGKLVEVAETRDTDAMKWVAGWIDDTSYLFWGSDTGTAWVHHLRGPAVTEAPLEGAACRRLEELFERKYGEHRGDCLKP
jgi:hypothetical protein